MNNNQNKIGADLGKVRQFLNSFKSNPKYLRFECQGCKSKLKMNKLKPAAFHDRVSNTMYVFRLCKDCYASFFRMDTESKFDFAMNILKKLRKEGAKKNEPISNKY